MILQALTDYYQALSRAGQISPPGWGQVKVSYALYLSWAGELTQAASIQTEQPRGKKTVLAPQTLTLPAPVKKTSGVKSNFLWENSSYLLGIDNKGKPQRSLECFAACRDLHEAVLEGVDSPAARALLAFFRTWDPAGASDHPALAECLEGILSGGNLVFHTPAGYVHDDPAVRRAWDAYYSSDGGDGPQGICLVTGQAAPLESVHPAIKNVAGAQSSGAALVSFNAPAFCSYGKEQSLNAPTGKFAAFAYTTALNHLLADRDHVFRVGDTTVVCWARDGGVGYQDLFQSFLLGDSNFYQEQDLRGLVKDLCAGRSVTYEAGRLDPDMDFFVLGLSPNAARLSVRFFLRNTFGALLANVQAHYDRLEIVRPSFDPAEHLPVWRLLGETVNQNARDKSPAPQLAGEVLRAILDNTPYPATLLNGVTLRIRAEHQVTRGRAAILKAYYLKLQEATNRENPDIPEEVLQVSLNPDAVNVPYTLGRLFSVLESIQSAANPGINATIKDKYFNSAAATPAVIFPILVNLAQKHLKKLRGSNPGLCVYYDKQLSQLCAGLGTDYPSRLNLPQQGSFQLGYYHQTQARYQGGQKKEETEHV